MRLSLRALSRMTTTTARTFLFWFSNEHTNFRIPELEALFTIFQLDERILNSRKVNGPFVLMNFPSDDGPIKLMSRSVLVHRCYELWGEGACKEELDDNVKLNMDLITPFIQESFQLRVETYGKTIQHAEKLQFINSMDYLPMEGDVNLTNPQCTLHLILNFGIDTTQDQDEPFDWYFGRWITDGQRKLVTKTSLKTRKFIGNTSMDPLLSLLMVNLAAVKNHDIVLDPFVGTGSILVAAAAMGCQVLGSDIDYLMLHGKTKPTKALQVTRTQGETVRGNMIQYGLESKYLDVIISDASRPLWRSEFGFDAIITDPPYGIREPTEKLGSAKSLDPSFKIKEEHLDRHYPAKQNYSLADIYCDLMDFAVQRLDIGGRLVCWIPLSRSGYDEAKLPKNPCLELIFNTEQVFNSCASRRLLVLRKTKEATSLCKTEMDGTSPMYRFQLFEPDPDKRKVRKKKAFEKFGMATKRGQSMPLSEMTIADS